MIYVQLRARVKLAQGETLHVADAAKVLGSEKAGHCSLFCPTAPGVYTLDAIAVAKALDGLKKIKPAPLGLTSDAALIEQANYDEDLEKLRGELDEALRIRVQEQLPVFEHLGDMLAVAITKGKIADV